MESLEGALDNTASCLKNISFTKQENLQLKPLHALLEPLNWKIGGRLVMFVIKMKKKKNTQNFTLYLITFVGGKCWKIPARKEYYIWPGIQ